MEIKTNRTNQATRIKNNNLAFKADITKLYISEPLHKNLHLDEYTSVENRVKKFEKELGESIVDVSGHQSNEAFKIGDKVIISQGTKKYIGKIAVIGQGLNENHNQTNEIIIKDSKNKYQEFKWGDIFTEDGLKKHLKEIKLKLGLLKK